MKKAKRNEVPKEYRRNYKKEIIEFLKILAICLIGVAIFYWLIIAFA